MSTGQARLPPNLMRTEDFRRSVYQNTPSAAKGEKATRTTLETGRSVSAASGQSRSRTPASVETVAGRGHRGHAARRPALSDDKLRKRHRGDVTR